MLTKLLQKKPDRNIKTEEVTLLKAQTSQTLLSREDRLELIRKIKRLFSVTDAVWLHHYYFAIEQFAELVQELPASGNHHHSEAGGLIDHTLEALHTGIRVSQGYVLPPNAEPEEISKGADRWRFGVFIAILAHDIGKILTDLDVLISHKGSFIKWHPWTGPIPKGSEYRFRAKPRMENARDHKSLHEKASLTLLPKLMTPKAYQWLFEDLNLVSQLFNTLSNAPSGGYVINEIVKKADKSSVASNLGARPEMASSTENAPLSSKLLRSLKLLVHDGQLKRNRPGAALWITENETWVVSKVAMEAVQLQLQEEGHKGIPKNVIRLYDTLLESRMVMPNPNGDPVWVAEVQDLSKNWNQQLTFLRFPNSVLWDNEVPSIFDGFVISDTTPTASKPTSPIPAVLEEPMSSSEKVTVDAQPSEDIALKETPKTQAPRKNHEYLKHEFIQWLVNGIERRRIRINEPKAPVHVLDDYIALVTPRIFNLYLETNSLKRKLYEQRAEDGRLYTYVQRELESLHLHQIGTNGQNIQQITIQTDRTSVSLKVYLLKKELFKSLKHLNVNKVMQLES